MKIFTVIKEENEVMIFVSNLEEDSDYSDGFALLGLDDDLFGKPAREVQEGRYKEDGTLIK